MKVDASEFSTRSTFICRAKGKGDVFFFKKIGFDWSGDITEGKEVSEWIWIDSSVSEVMEFVEYVLVGARTWSSSRDEEYKESPP